MTATAPPRPTSVPPIGPTSSSNVKDWTRFSLALIIGESDFDPAGANARPVTGPADVPGLATGRAVLLEVDIDAELRDRVRRPVLTNTEPGCAPALLVPTWYGLRIDTPTGTRRIRSGATRSDVARLGLGSSGWAVADTLPAGRLGPGRAAAFALRGSRLLLSLPKHAVAGAGSRSTRSAVHYLTRTALKPSPFSTLGTLSAVRWNAGGSVPEPSALPSGQPEALLRSTFRPLAMAIFLSCLSTPEAWQGDPDWAVLDPETADLDGAGLALIPLYTKAHGVYFRHDELTPWPGHGVAPDRIAPGRSWPGTADASARAVAMGVLHPATPWALSDSIHLAALPDRLSRTALSTGVVKQVTAAARAERQLVEATDAAGVIAATESLREAATEVFAELGVPAPEWLVDAPLAYETVVASSPAPSRGRKALRRLESHLHDAVRVAPSYQQLTRYFLQRHGAGGRTRLLDFCFDVLSAMERLSVLPDTTPAPVGTLPRGHLSLSVPSSTVFFQELPGTDRIVLNKLYPGCLGALTRWADVPALAAHLEAEIGELAQARNPGCRTYQYTASADWTTVQRPAATSLPLAVWAAERAAPAMAATEVVPLAGFSLRHDVATATLQIEDGSGPAALLYTGAVPPFLLSGVSAVLGMISDPWTARLGASDGPTPSGFSPRVELDDVVLRRARWSIPPACMPTWDGEASPVEALLRIHTGWRRMNLPNEAYVTAHRSGTPGKPSWLRLDHPLTLLTLLRTDPRVRSWTVTEALPSVEGMRAESVGEVTEYMAVLDHD